MNMTKLALQAISSVVCSYQLGTSHSVRPRNLHAAAVNEMTKTRNDITLASRMESQAPYETAWRNTKTVSSFTIAHDQASESE